MAEANACCGRLANTEKTLTFDAAGNNTVVDADGTLTTFTWDGDGRLSVAELSTGERVTMSYDSSGLRRRREDNGGTTNYVWDGKALLMELSGGGTQARYTAGVGEYGPLVSQSRSSISHFYLADELGTIHGLADAAESLTDRYILDAFGEAVATSGSTTNPHRYVGALGYYVDSDLGLPYVRSRWLRPGSASWLSPDLDESQPPFSYVGYVPTLRTDPSGEGFVVWILAGVVVAQLVCTYLAMERVKDRAPWENHDYRIHSYGYCRGTLDCGVDTILGDKAYCMTEWAQAALNTLGLARHNVEDKDVAANKAGGAIGIWIRRGQRDSQGRSYHCGTCTRGAQPVEDLGHGYYRYRSSCLDSTAIRVKLPRC